MKYRGIYLRVGIVVVVVALTALAYLAYTSAQAQRATVIAAAVDIPQGYVITAEMLGTRDLPRGSESGYAQSQGEVLGRVAQVNILAGAPISLRMLSDRPPPAGRLLPSGLAVPPGKVALALPAQALRSVGGALKIGDRVTLLAPQSITTTGEVASLGGTIDLPQAQAVTYTVLYSDVLVLDLRNAGGESLVAGEAKGAAASILLALAPQQAADVARYRDLLVVAIEGGSP